LAAGVRLFQLTVVVFVVTVIVVVIIVVVIVIVITSIQGIYNYIPETHHVPRVYSISDMMCG